MGDNHVHARLHLLLHPALPFVGRSAQDGCFEASIFQHPLPFRLDVEGIGLLAEQQHLAPGRFLFEAQFDDFLFFGTDKIFGEGINRGDDALAARAADHLAPAR